MTGHVAGFWTGENLDGGKYIVSTHDASETKKQSKQILEQIFDNCYDIIIFPVFVGSLEGT